MPAMKLLRRRSIGPSMRMSARRGSSSSNSTLISIRASWAPRHRCGLISPNATCGLGERRMSNVNGSAKTASS